METTQPFINLIKHLVVISDTEDMERLKKLNYTLLKDRGYEIKGDEDIDVYDYTYATTSSQVQKYLDVSYASLGCESEIKKYNMAILNWLVVWYGYTLSVEEIIQVLKDLIEEEQLMCYVTVSQEELIKLWIERVIMLGANIADHLHRQHIQKYPTEDIVPLYLDQNDTGIICVYTTNHLLERSEMVMR